ncbi:hypothetical protein ACOBQB_07115 [Streptomyces sp. G5(2025)]|uniref:hypothetical protein n=1 Tax=Streptomyces sp. G5(2025) TaxID=3406628 RepID=UPI003C15E3EE
MTPEPSPEWADTSVELAKLWTSSGGAKTFVVVFVIFALVLVALLLRSKNRPQNRRQN